jgi:hypothetical protein
MKSVLLLLGALWAVVPSVSSTLVYPDDARVLRTNRARHVGRGAISHVRDASHLSDFRIRSAPQEIGSFDLAGTINPGIILSM